MFKESGVFDGGECLDEVIRNSIKFDRASVLNFNLTNFYPDPVVYSARNLKLTDGI